MELFMMADKNGDGSISREECNAMLTSQEAVTRLIKHMNVKVQDLQELFDWLDYNKDGEVTAHEFIQGFLWLNDPLNTKSLIKLHHRLITESTVLKTSIANTLDERFSGFLRMVQGPLRKIHAVTEQIHNLDSTFREIRSVLEDEVERDKSTECTTEGLQAAEKRLAQRIDEMSLRVKRLSQLSDQGVVSMFLH